MMKFLVAVVALALVALTGAVPPRPLKVPRLNATQGIGSRIINGQSAADGQFPWQVAVYFQEADGSYFCGGSLISPKWVLTAGHCVADAYSFEIHLGLTDLGLGGTIVQTTLGHPHPQYDPFFLTNDIALIELREEVTLTPNIQTIPLDTQGVATGTGVTVSGWGKTSDAELTVSQTLNFVDLTTISNQECQSYYGTLGSGVVCATGPDGKSTCNGDSGGPLITGSGANALHRAVVSFVSSAGCASGAPSGYTRTADYRDWINEVSGV